MLHLFFIRHNNLIVLSTVRFMSDDLIITGQATDIETITIVKLKLSHLQYLQMTTLYQAHSIQIQFVMQ